MNTTRTLIGLLAAAALIAGAGCEGSAGGFTHAAVPSEVTSELTYTIGGGASEVDRLGTGARLQQCRGREISLSIAPGALGDRRSPRLSTLYLKVSEPLDPGTHPLHFDGTRWTTAWALDGTLTPDSSRSIAPFAMEPGGTIDGQAVIDRSEIGEGGARTIAGVVTAKVDGDEQHRLDFSARFTVTYSPADGCP